MDQNDSSKLSNCGVLYAVTGQKYFAELRTSLCSLRKIHPTLPIAIFISNEEEIAERELAGVSGLQIINLSGQIVERGYDASNGFVACRVMKLLSVNVSPFERTLFLDNDTYIRGALDPIFDALEGVDAADVIVTNEPVARNIPDNNAEERQLAVELIALSNPEFYNGGVFGFRREVNKTDFDKRWFEIWKRRTKLDELPLWTRYCDQTALNNAISSMPNLKRRVFSNAIWNAQCKILQELYLSARWDDIRIIHCKMVHVLGPEPEKLMQSTYIRGFRIQTDK